MHFVYWTRSYVYDTRCSGIQQVLTYLMFPTSLRATCVMSLERRSWSAEAGVTCLDSGNSSVSAPDPCVLLGTVYSRSGDLASLVLFYF